MNKAMNDFSILKEIKRMIVERGLTQKELARKSGVTEANISLYLSGKAEPNLSSLMRILDALNARITLKA